MVKKSDYKAKTSIPFVLLFGTGLYIIPLIGSILGFNSSNIYLLIIYVLLLLLSTPILFIIELFRNSEKPILNMALSVASIFYISIPLSLIHLIGLIDGQLVLLILITIWSSDSGAYFTGKSIGKHKLFERVSPNKTWEGFFGSLVFSVVACICFYYLSSFHKESAYGLFAFIGLGAVISVFGTIGDLCESLIKRKLGVKDSGSILPGHGGVLDRFDAFIFVLPFVITYFIIISLF